MIDNVTRYDVYFENGTPSEGLRHLQEIQLEILKQFLSFCDEINVRPFLVAGSALGAVRHGSIIPWDDDIDVGLLREDYTKFVDAFERTPVPGLFLQSYKTEPTFRLSYAKLRRHDTLVFEQQNVGLDIHQGIFLDIFPFDFMTSNRTVDNVKSYSLQFLELMLTCNSQGRVVSSARTLVRLTRRLFWLLDNRFSARILFECRRFFTTLCSNNAREIYCCFSMYGPINFKKTIVSDQELFPLKYLPFANSEVPVPHAFETLLTRTFGDYNSLPPEKHQVPGHSEYIEIFSDRGNDA